MPGVDPACEAKPDSQDANLYATIPRSHRLGGFFVPAVLVASAADRFAGFPIANRPDPMTGCAIAPVFSTGAVHVCVRVKTAAQAVIPGTVGSVMHLEGHRVDSRPRDAGGKSTPREAANLLTTGLFGWWGPKATGPAPANLIVWASGHLTALRGAGPALPSAPRPHQQTRLSLSPSDGRGTSLFPCTRPKISRFRQIFRRFGVAPDKCRGPRARSQSPVNRRRPAIGSGSPYFNPSSSSGPRTWCSGHNLAHKG